MQFNKLLAFAAITGVALGANNSTLTSATPTAASGCSFSSFTATNNAGVQSVAACPTAVGDITIEGQGINDIDLTQVKEVYGDLIVTNANLTTSLLAPNLELVSGTLNISEDARLATLNLAQLTTVGQLVLQALPALEKTGLTSGLTSAESVIISDTGLTSLDGINVYELKVFNVNNNADIETVNSGLKSVTDTLSFADNSESVDVKLDQLTTAKNVGFQRVNSLSVGNLTSVNGSLSVTSSNIDKIEFPALKSIGNSLTINTDDSLEEIDFPQLTSVGGALQIADNEKLDSFAGFPKLKTIGGSVNLTGTFDNGTFPSLNSVAGGFNLESDGDLTCSSFDQLNKNHDIKGDKYQCSAAGSSSSSSSSKSGNSKTSSDSSSDSSSTSSGSSSTKSSSKNSGGNTIEGRLSAIIAGIATFGLAMF